MKCKRCSDKAVDTKMRVLNSRWDRIRNRVRRRRECPICKERTTTIELPVADANALSERVKILRARITELENEKRAVIATVAAFTDPKPL